MKPRNGKELFHFLFHLWCTKLADQLREAGQGLFSWLHSPLGKKGTLGGSSVRELECKLENVKAI